MTEGADGAAHGAQVDALQRSEARTRAVIENVVDCLVLMEPIRDEAGSVVDFRCVEANAGMLKLAGRDREALVGGTAREIFAGRAAELHERWCGVLATGETSRYEVSLQDRDYAIAVFRVDESTIGCAAEDISDRKRAEGALRESEARFRRLYECGMFGAMIGSYAGEVLDANDYLLRLLGWSRADLPRPWADGALPEYAHLDARAAEQFRSDGVVEPYEKEVRTPDGTRVPVLASGAAIPGDTTQFLAITVDIRKQKEAEAALREADRRKTEFLAVLSHEIRNPLAAIRCAAYVLDRAAQGSRQEIRAKEVIQRQTHHLADLVDDLLDLSRISHGKIVLARSRFDARDVVRRACEDIRPAYDQGGVVLTLEVAGEPLWLDADPTRVAQIAGNLLTNALKFTPASGAVSVCLRALGGACELRVRDTGAGIEPHLLERIFEPFEQSERTRDRARGGLGIGLTLVKTLVLLHGGGVRAASEGVDRGAEIIVSLPLAAPPEIEEAPAASPAATGLSVLIVEDNQDAGETLAALLELQGHQPRVFPSGRSGIAALSGWTPDVILCDVGLPDITGYQVMQQVRQLANGGAIFSVALTGYAQPEDVQRAWSAGFDAHLPKPPSLDQLREVLGSVASRQRLGS